MVQLSLRHVLIITLFSAIVGAGLVVSYDRWAERPAGTTPVSTSSSPATSPQAAADSTAPANTVAAATDDERNNIEVYRAVSPGVVNISTLTYVRDFFAVYEREGGGSGSIIDQQGHILTNYHVVEGARKLTVTLANGKQYPAKIIGGDVDTDIAVIKIDAPEENLRVVKTGDSSNLAVGQKVLAIGNPFGLTHTLTQGIISALERPIRAENGRVIEGAIQTDASINPGNSGGPLLNSGGEMIGINSQIITPSEGSVGIGFAIPINLGMRVVPDLIAYGRVSRPWLGIEIVPVPVSLVAEELDLPVDYGVMVSRVFENESADKAGIRGGTRPVRVRRQTYYLGGDIITSMDGEKIESFDQVDRILNRHRPGDTIPVEIVRHGRRMTLRMTLTTKPARR